MRKTQVIHLGIRSTAVVLLSTLAAVLAPRGVARADCAFCQSLSSSSYTLPEVIVGSPSGQARPFNVSFSLVNHSASIQEVWIGYDTDNLANQGAVPPRSYTTAGGDLFCKEPLCADLTWPYQAVAGNGTYGASVTFYPRFGSDGSKAVLIQCLVACNGGYTYSTVGSAITARSTDLDADGDTDQLDKIAIGRALAVGSTDQRYNLNTDLLSNTVVDTADYNVIVNEMKRTIPDTLLECSGNLSSETPDSPFVPTRVADTSPPGVTTLSVSTQSGYSYTFQWTAPGDDSDDAAHGYQQLGVAEEYDLRYSCAPITSGNFTSATRVTVGVPAPALAGTTQSATLTVDGSMRYWAIRTKDHFGNWSAVSSSLQISPPQTVADLGFCATFKTCALVGFTAPTDTIYDLRYSSYAINNECDFSGANPLSLPANQHGIVSTFLTGLSPGHDYYAAVRTRATPTAPWSAISNIASTHTTTIGTSCNMSVACSGDGFSSQPAVPESPAELQFLAIGASAGERTNTFLYSIPPAHAGEPLRIEVFDLAGRRVADLVNGTSAAGSFSAHWDHSTSGGSQAHAGLYFARMRIGSEQLRRTIVVKP